jgi:L-rhamnose-proton symport protein RhaT
MAPNLWLGIVLTLFAGLLSGNCMLPMKFARRWPWENTWLVFSVVSLVILPWALAFVLVNDVGSVYAALPASAFVAPLGFGAGWGIAQVLFGLSIARLGLALGYAIIVGLGAVLGTLVPLFVKDREVIGTGRGSLILAGVAIMVLGIAVSARAGKARESSAERPVSGRYAAALAIAVLCGLMAPMLNYAFAFGQSIADEAVRQGASPQAAGYSVWPIALVGGLIPNAGYSVWLLTRNGTWNQFRGAGSPDVWLGCLMGVFWMGAFAIYGVSSVYLGALGTSVGWALFQIFMIMTANLSGVLTGEWKSAPARAKRGLWMGLALLAAATVVIAAGNR